MSRMDIDERIKLNVKFELTTYLIDTNVSVGSSSLSGLTWLRHLTISGSVLNT